VAARLITKGYRTLLMSDAALPLVDQTGTLAGLKIASPLAAIRSSPPTIRVTPASFHDCLDSAADE
jgi:hypothetical protein